MPKSTSFLIINTSSKYNDSKFETPCQKREHKVSKKKKRAQKFTFQSKRDKCQAANSKSSTFL